MFGCLEYIFFDMLSEVCNYFYLLWWILAHSVGEMMRNIWIGHGEHWKTVRQNWVLPVFWDWSSRWRMSGGTFSTLLLIWWPEALIIWKTSGKFTQRIRKCTLTKYLIWYYKIRLDLLRFNKEVALRSLINLRVLQAYVVNFKR